jgi:hypothetical protein
MPALAQSFTARDALLTTSSVAFANEEILLA